MRNGDTMNLCKDCRYCVKPPMYATSPGQWQCGNTSYIDPVAGETVYRFYCGIERSAKTLDSCGPDGKYFEPITEEVTS